MIQLNFNQIAYAHKWVNKAGAYRQKNQKLINVLNFLLMVAANIILIYHA